MKIAQDIPGYDYDNPALPASRITLQQLDALKQTAGFTAMDELYLRMAGKVLEEQTEQIVDLWRSGIIASIPNLARHSRSLEGDPLPHYLQRSNLRFRQWILDTCMRPYDEAWLAYQSEIALRHTSLKKNQTDSVSSTDHVPFRDVVAFVAVLNETIRPFLTSKGNSEEEIEGMHLAWQKSMQIQIAIWGQPYMKAAALCPHW